MILEQIWAYESLVCVMQLSPWAPRDRCKCLTHGSVWYSQAHGPREMAVSRGSVWCRRAHEPKRQLWVHELYVWNTLYEQLFLSEGLNTVSWDLLYHIIPVLPSPPSIDLASGDVWLKNLWHPQLLHLHTRQEISSRIKANPIVLRNFKGLFNIKIPQIDHHLHRVPW